MLRRQLRHIPEVHAVPAGNERQGQEHRGDNGQDLHDLVLPHIHLRLVHLPQLEGILLLLLRHGQQPLGLAGEMLQQPLDVLLCVRDSIGQHGIEVVQLGIVARQHRQLPADAEDLLVEILRLLRQQNFLQCRQALLVVLEAFHVLRRQPGQQLRQQLSRGLPRKARQQALQKTALFHQQQFFLRQIVAEEVLFAGGGHALGHGVGPDDAALEPLRLAEYAPSRQDLVPGGQLRIALAKGFKGQQLI